MVKFKTILLLVGILFCSACSSVKEPVAKKANEENQFWQAFRQAVLDDNVDTVISMTHFPFEVRKPDDSAPVKRYEQQDFPALYEQLIAQQVYYPSGGAMSSKPMRQLIAEKQQITPGDFIKPNLIQFLQFEFDRIDGRWLFTRAYLEE